MKKRADGRYQLSVMIGYDGQGKQKRKLVYGKTQKEVQEKANTLRMQYNMGLIIDSDMTVTEWAKTWLDTYKSGVGYNTRKMYEGIIDTYITPSIGLLKLKDVKTAHLQKIVNDNADKTRTTELFKLTASQMFNQAVINDLIIKNPALGISLPTNIKVTQKRALTEEEMDKIKTLELDDRTRCFVYLLMYTGMRRGEALAVKRSDIDLKKNEITVNKALIFITNKSEIKPNPKTKAGVRVIPLLSPLQPILTDYMDLVKTDYLFTTQNGETMTKIAYRRMWQKFEKAMGTKEITAHIFRHNFATILYNAGADVKAAQVILGHSSISVTLDIYTHLNNKNNEQTASKLNEYLK